MYSALLLPCNVSAFLRIIYNLNQNADSHLGLFFFSLFTTDLAYCLLISKELLESKVISIKPTFCFQLELCELAKCLGKPLRILVQKQKQCSVLCCFFEPFISAFMLTNRHYCLIYGWQMEKYNLYTLTFTYIHVTTFQCCCKLTFYYLCDTQSLKVLSSKIYQLPIARDSKDQRIEL